MKFLITLALACAFITPSYCQTNTAKVIELSTDDARQAAYLADEQAKLTKKIETFNLHVQTKYLTENYTNKYGINIPLDPRIKDGWYHGFEFSEDYKFIVPKFYTTSYYYNCWGTTDPGGSSGWPNSGSPIITTTAPLITPQN